MKETEASATAYAVQQGLLHVGRQPRYGGLVPPEALQAAEAILGATEEGRRRLKQLDSGLFRAAVPLLERLLVPGLGIHYALRKRFIEDEAVTAIGEGVTQVVNLGAGFDTLFWRLHARFPEVNFIEIDHPATSAAKARALTDRAAGAGNLHMLAVDFTRQTLAGELGPFAAFRSERPTLYLCEGVLPYLTAGQITDLLRTLTALSEKAVRLVCTCVEPLDHPDNNTGPLLGAYLRLKGEDIHFRIAHDAAAPFFAERGFTVDRVATFRDFRAAYLTGIDHGVLHGGEYGVVTRATPAG